MVKSFFIPKNVVVDEKTLSTNEFGQVEIKEFATNFRIGAYNIKSNGSIQYRDDVEYLHFKEWIAQTLTADRILTFDFFAEEGTYDLLFYYQKGNNKAIIDFHLNGEPTPTLSIDNYSSTSGNETHETTIDLVKGLNKIELKNPTKNASSSGRRFNIYGLIFRKQ